MRRHDYVLVSSVVEPDPSAFNPVGLEGELPFQIFVQLFPSALSHWLGHDLFTALKGHAIEVAHVDAVVRRFVVRSHQVSVDEVAGHWNRPFDDGPAASTGDCKRVSRPVLSARSWAFTSPTARSAAPLAWGS